MVLSAMGLKLGVFWLKTNVKQMRPWSLHAVQHFRHIYLYTETAVDAGDIRTWRTTVILIMGKPQRSLIWAPYRDKNGAGSGISLYLLVPPIYQVYIYISFRFWWILRILNMLCPEVSDPSGKILNSAVLKFALPYNSNSSHVFCARVAGTGTDHWIPRS